MWAVSEWLLSRLDSSSVIVFLLVFLVGYYWFMTAPSNLPPGPRALPVVGTGQFLTYLIASCLTEENVTERKRTERGLTLTDETENRL